MNKGCSVDGCEAKHKGRGLCHKHLQRLVNTGTTEPRRVETVEERFWSRIDKTDTCWLWVAGKTAFGYGTINQYGRGTSHLLAHRVSWQIHHGSIPPGMNVCHSCDVPACVNPEHLFLGSQRDNVRDMHAKGRDSNGVRAVGSANRAAKLTEADVIEIRRRLALGETQASIAGDFPVGRTTISWIKNGQHWKHV